MRRREAQAIGAYIEKSGRGRFVDVFGWYRCSIVFLDTATERRQEFRDYAAFRAWELEEAARNELRLQSDLARFRAFWNKASSDVQGSGVDVSHATTQM